MRIKIAALLICLSLYACNSSNKKETFETNTNHIKNSELKESIERGEGIYNDFCVVCHMPDGKGVPKTFPPLAKSDYLISNRKESIKAIKYGLSGEITVNGETYNTAMTRLGLSDAEVADVMNYISNSWGNKNSTLTTIKEVSKIKP